MAGTVPISTDQGHLLVMMRRQTNSVVHRRMNALLLPDDSRSAARVALDARTPLVAKSACAFVAVRFGLDR